MEFLSDLFEPPYFAVIFASVRTGDEQAAYEAEAASMMALAAEQEGYLGVETIGTGGQSITVSYWKDEESIKAWREHADHIEARRKGRSLWYKDYRLRVAKVERNYGQTSA